MARIVLASSKSHSEHETLSYGLELAVSPVAGIAILGGVLDLQYNHHAWPRPRLEQLPLAANLSR